MTHALCARGGEILVSSPLPYSYSYSHCVQSFMPYYMLNRNNLFSFLGENDKAERGCRAMPNYSSYFIIYNISHIFSHKCMSDIYTQVESRFLYSVNILHECKHKRHSCLTVLIAFILLWHLVEFLLSFFRTAQF